MRYHDEELLEARRERERKKHTTLETGIFVGDELIRFTYTTFSDLAIRLPLPKHFMILPDVIKNVKYPSTYAPRIVMSSLDVLINFTFDRFEVKDGDIKAMAKQFQTALKNADPSLIIKGQANAETDQGNEMSWFGYGDHQIDGQSYNRACLIKMKDFILYTTFNCPSKEKGNWENIIEKIFMAIEEM